MNDTCEMWNLPWQALQKDLARGLGADAFSPSAAADKSVRSNSSASALSWLSKARLRAAPRAPTRRAYTPLR